MTISELGRATRNLATSDEVGCASKALIMHPCRTKKTLDHARCTIGRASSRTESCWASSCQGGRNNYERLFEACEAINMATNAKMSRGRCAAAPPLHFDKLCHHLKPPRVQAACPQHGRAEALLLNMCCRHSSSVNGAQPATGDKTRVKPTNHDLQRRDTRVLCRRAVDESPTVPQFMADRHMAEECKQRQDANHNNI